MKYSIKTLFVLFFIVSPLFSQISLPKLFENDWNIKADDFKKANQSKGITEQDMSAYPVKGVTIYNFNDKMDKLPVKVSYIFTKDGLAMKQVTCSGQDKKLSAGLLKSVKENIIKKFGKVSDEKEMNGMKMLNWSSSKTFSIMMSVMGDNFVLMVGDKKKMKDVK